MTMVKGTPAAGNASPARVEERNARRQLLEVPRPRGMERW